MRRAGFLLLLGCLAGTGAHAQTAAERLCRPTDFYNLLGRSCITTIQALASTQAAVGALAGGAAPITSSLGAAGFQLSVLPGVSAGVRWNVLSLELPDIVSGEPHGSQEDRPAISGVLPAFNGEVAIALSDGFTAGPGLGGIGALSLIGSFSYLPLSLFEAEGFRGSTHGFGMGGRLQLLDESFTVPGVYLSVVRRGVNDVRVGDICIDPAVEMWAAPSDPEAPSTCRVEYVNHAGELDLDLTSWSARIGAGKHFRGIGVSGGIGHDWYGSDAKVAFYPRRTFTQERVAFTKFPSVDLTTNRWSAFGDVSYTLLVGTVSLQAGWQQGQRPVDGFEETRSSFNPRKGSWFGGISGKIAL